MDPDEALKRLREKATEFMLNLPEDPVDNLGVLGSEVVELFEALDGWMSKGGFLPAEWRKHRGDTSSNESSVESFPEGDNEHEDT